MSYCAIHGRPLTTAGLCDFCGLYGGRDYRPHDYYITRCAGDTAMSKEEIREELRRLRQRVEELENQLWQL